MRPVWGYSDPVCHLVQSIIGRDINFGECRALSVFDSDDRLVGGVVFHDWQPDPRTIELTAASTDRRWLTRAVLRSAFNYVFDTCHCQMALARTHEDNATVRRLWKALGAKEFVIPRLEGRSKAGVVLTLTDEAWRKSKFAG